MTNIDAIEILKCRKTCMECVRNVAIYEKTCNECNEAFDLAIKALEESEQLRSENKQLKDKLFYLTVSGCEE